MRKTDLAYLVGFFDGEGSVMLALNKGGTLRLSVACSQNTETVLNMYVRGFGGHVYSYQPKLAKSPMFQWRINGAEAVGFLEQARPYLLVKLVPALEAIKAWGIRSDKAELAKAVKAHKDRIAREKALR
jgi:hypothetical protein